MRMNETFCNRQDSFVLSRVLVYVLKKKLKNQEIVRSFVGVS